MQIRKAIAICFLAFARLNHAIDDTITIVDGVVTNIGAYIPSGTNNLLIVTNSGLAAVTTIALQPSARSNVVIVVGNGSSISNSILSFASSGISNALVLRDGGTLVRNFSTGGTNNLILAENTALTLGSATFAGRSNHYILNNALLNVGSSQVNTLSSEFRLNGSQWSDSDFRTEISRSNLFVVAGGSERFAAAWFMAGIANALQVTDPGSLWKVTNLVSVANSGLSNPGSAITISLGAQAEILHDFDLGGSSSYNSLTVDGPGSQASIAGALSVGVGLGAKSNRVAISGGAHLQTGSAVVGSSVANSIAVSGSGTTWDNANALLINDASNRIDILDGAKVTTGRFSNNGKSNVINIAPSASFMTGDFSVAKNLKVTGGGSVFSSQYSAMGSPGQSMELSGASTWLVTSNLNFPTTGNTLVISEGATAHAATLGIGNVTAGQEVGVSNVVMITGPGSALDISSIVLTSRWDTIRVADGARLISDTFLSMHGNSLVDVSGTNTSWLNSGNVENDTFSTNDVIQVSGGAIVTNADATIGGTTASASTLTRAQLKVDGSGSKWITATNLIIGLNANSNSFAISNGGEGLIGDLFIGRAQTNRIVGPMPGSQNSFAIDGADSRLTAGTIHVGHGSSSNVFNITGGALVIADTFTAGETPPGLSGISGMYSNVVALLGTNSTLTVSSNFSVGGSSHLVVSNFARLSAGGPAILSDHTSIRDQSELSVTGLLAAPTTELLVENSHITAAQFDFGGYIRPGHAVVTGPKSFVNAGVFNIGKADPRSPDSYGSVIFEVLNSAAINTPTLTIGENVLSNPSVLNVDGGFVTATSPTNTGSVEIHYGALTIHHGSVYADTLRLHNDLAYISADGPLLVAAGSIDVDGSLRIGNREGSTQFRGTNRVAKLSIAPAPGSSGSVSVLGGQTYIADPSNLSGPIDIGLGGSGELIVSNAVVLGGSATFGSSTGGVAKLQLQNGAQMHVSGDLAIASGSEFKATIAPGAVPLIADGAAKLGGHLTLTLGTAPQTGDTITLLTATSISGAFDNAATGSRISTADGLGSLLLSIGPTTVTLSDFQSDFRLGTVSFDAKASTLSLTFPTASGASLQTSTNLVDWADVQNTQSQTVGDQTQIKVNVNAAEPQRFYRLRR